MARSRKPRHAHRRKPVGRPILDHMRNELVLPAYSALEVLRIVDDPEALESAWHTLAALCNTAHVAAEMADMPVDKPAAGQAALTGMLMRQQRTGIYRPTGPELQALRETVTWFDGACGAMRTDHIIRAIAHVNAVLFGTEESRAC